MLQMATPGIGKQFAGKEGKCVERGFVHNVVLHLVVDDRLQHKGYVAVTNNFFSSPALFCNQVAREIGACGTLCKDRGGIPSAISSAPVRKDEVASCRDDEILSLKWKDMRDILMLNTYHDSSVVQKSQRLLAAKGGIEVTAKLCEVEDYNMNTGGVDKNKFTHICICTSNPFLLTFR